MEIWKDIEGYKNIYQVSNLGRLKSLKREINWYGGRTRIIPEKIIKVKFNGFGYKMHSLSRHGKNKYVSLHRLIALAFIPNPENEKCINHIDGNKLNNSLENLEWCSYSHNTKHAYAAGLISKSKRRLPNCLKFFMKSLFNKGYSKLKISKILNCSLSTVIRNLQKA